MLMLEMQHRGLRVDRAGMLEMAMQFWRGINYPEAANRVAEVRVENNLRAHENREQEAIQPQSAAFAHFAANGTPLQHCANLLQQVRAANPGQIDDDDACPWSEPELGRAED
jgi:hypothetical protein